MDINYVNLQCFSESKETFERDDKQIKMHGWTVCQLCKFRHCKQKYGLDNMTGKMPLVDGKYFMQRFLSNLGPHRAAQTCLSMTGGLSFKLIFSPAPKKKPTSRHQNFYILLFWEMKTMDKEHCTLEVLRLLHWKMDCILYGSIVWEKMKSLSFHGKIWLGAMIQILFRRRHCQGCKERRPWDLDSFYSMQLT